MSDVELQARLQEIGTKLQAAFPMIERVDATPYTDSTGDDAVRFLIVLTDPPGGGVHPFSVLEPIMSRVYDLAGDLGRQPYVGFRLASEDQALAEGTYFG